MGEGCADTAVFWRAVHLRWLNLFSQLLGLGLQKGRPWCVQRQGRLSIWACLTP